MNASSTITLHSGNEMPVIGLGTWELTDHTAAVVAEAIEMGYRLIDTSGDYGTQPGVGEGVRRSGVEPGQLYLETKVEEDENAYESARNDLGELDQAYADLILIHRPPAYGAGEDLWEGLLRAKAEGLTRDIGVSNYSIEQMQALMNAFGEVPVVNQIEWSPFGHSRQMLDFCRENDIIIQAYSPLTHGHKIEDRLLERMARSYDKTPAQLLIRWNIQLGIVPLPKANHVDHLAENLDVFDFEISGRDMTALHMLNRGYSALGKVPAYQR